MSTRMIQHELQTYRPARLFALFVTGKFFMLIRVLCILGALISIGAVAYGVVVVYRTTGGVSLSDAASVFPFWTGVGYIAVAVLLVFRALRFYYNAYYYRGLKSILSSEVTAHGITYEVAEICMQNPGDLTKALFTSQCGRLFALRLGVPSQAFAEYFNSDRVQITVDTILLPDDEMFSLYDLMCHVYQCDAALPKFLETYEVREDIYVPTAEWIFRDHIRAKARSRRWSMDNLSASAGIGQEFSYGVAYLLQQYTRSIRSGTVFSGIGTSGDYGKEYVAKIEAILARSKEANVLIVGEAGVGKMDLLVEVGRRMASGKAVGAVTGKHLMVLDTELLLANHGEKADLERMFIKLLSQAAAAGNIILVLDKLWSFIESAQKVGVDAAAILDPYLNTPELHVAATIDTRAYHQRLQNNGALLRRFETVLVEAPDLSATTTLLLDLLPQYETRHSLFTYAAVSEITRAADQYLVQGVMPDKAVHLLDEIATAAKKQKAGIVDHTYVQQFVSQKTGIPVGPLEQTEQDVLLNLEAVLHERIVGQERAVSAISSVMRRSRAGIGDSKRPIGSFLFLGPTGVGKTETAKALAAVFFKSDEAMHRINMPEYSGPDAIDRLIGSAEQGGELSQMLREHPYAVVLLDEFEKADTAVHDLFLSIIDEGVFTDGRGERVNARNSIIIATSNAGSEKIIEWMDKGIDLQEKQGEIVDYIIAQKIFKPELVNRFDGTIMFEPLARDQQRVIAEAMLKKLAERIRQKGYVLAITPELVDGVVHVGYQPEFGARPMRRAIQNHIEEAIAKKILAGTLKKGDTIELTSDELGLLSNIQD